ncbi:MaoC family dehydratase [Glaciecola sp. KUL10]|uniref:MaoC family dehydratase n=1 Tax=Glaciecola sp. (strain KUL10) TaxID=2161813 RepID=UPI000D782F02|nr:MaoC family dehydratase [Glaciecola sp. KUL10]GBL03215.1 acyl dehydratase [Glaciecola sp. KUL10]
MKFSDLTLGQIVESDQWLVISQEMIQMFADATGDHQWIHLDQERCKNESPFKTTIAHGFLTTSLMPKCFGELITIDPSRQTLLNYGVDSLRFLESVRVDDAIKYRFELIEIEQKPNGKLHKVKATVLIKGREKPALVGVFLSLLIG